MDSYQSLWENFQRKIESKKYIDAVEFWEPKTRSIFVSLLKDFRKKHRSWKNVQYVGTIDNNYIIVKYEVPKGIAAKIILECNKYRHGSKKNGIGKHVMQLYEFLKEYRDSGEGILHSLIGCFLKEFNSLLREYASDEVFKRYSIVYSGARAYISWSYVNQINTLNLRHKYELSTFIIFSDRDCTMYYYSLKNIDDFISSIIHRLNIAVEKISVFYISKSHDFVCPKNNFVAPSNNSILISSIRINFGTLRHELLHSIIFASTNSWPTLFFREGYAESEIDNNEKAFKALTSKYPICFLLYEKFFFDYTETPTFLSGILVKYLIDEYGLKKFYTVYERANNTSTSKVLKREYGLNIYQLKKRALDKWKQQQK